MCKAILFLKTRRYCSFFLLMPFLLFSCGEKVENTQKQERKPLAKVGESVLYEQEVERVVREEEGLDSIALRERFVNNWIRKELLLQTAKMNLTEKEQDVEDMVQSYRASLLINQYKQKYLAKHLDTLVTKEEIAIYIKEYEENFILKEPLYRYYLAKVLTKNTRDVKFLSALFSKKDIDLMQDFHLENTTVITSNETDWYTAADILKVLHAEVDKEDLKKLKEGKVFVTKDKTSTYLLRPIEIIKEGKVSPQAYIESRVREIILHNRKIALAKQLEYELYEDAKTKNRFEVY